ncbi:MAG: tRNA-dihydrouridine synthase, partial [Clostridia bacterium]|nr:tRNA-dihydrouridine synthase [Clostridia bacterium]
VAEAAAMLAARRPSAIEINMGCPVKKIISSGDGSALMKDPDLAGKITEAASRAAHAAGLPLWVKIRAGWKKGDVTAPVFADTLVSAGADRITVHGRTRDQMYAPSSDNGVIRAVKEKIGERAEIFGNGDVDSPESAIRMIEETGCDGVLVGRAALGDPWIFGRIRAALAGEDIPPVPTKEERVSAAIRLLRDVCALYGEDRGVRESRGRAARFIKGIKGSAAVRDRLNRAATEAEFEEILSHLI